MTDLFENVWGDQAQISAENVVDVVVPVSPDLASETSAAETRPADGLVRDIRRRLWETYIVEGQSRRSSRPQNDLQGRYRLTNTFSCHLTLAYIGRAQCRIAQYLLEDRDPSMDSETFPHTSYEDSPCCVRRTRSTSHDLNGNSSLEAGS